MKYFKKIFPQIEEQYISGLKGCDKYHQNR